jgi:hypothetical protein
MNTKILTSLFAGVLLLTSCADDRDSNPTVQQPGTFTLNTPALAGNEFDLENTESIEFTYKQPEYGYTAPVLYYTQVALADNWVDATDDADASYVELDGSSTECISTTTGKAVNRAIMKLGGYESEGDVPQSTTLYVRMHAKLAAGYDCYSNVVTLNVHPYFSPLVAADPVLWYLVGNSIGDGSWGSTIGKAAVPMSPVDGYEFDEFGLGQLTYTGYFFADQGWKIIKVPGTWDENEWGGDDSSIDSPHWKGSDGNAGSDFKVPSDGYYTIVLDTKAMTMTITATAEAPKTYAAVGISGSFNGWTYQDLTPVNTAEGSENHIWTADVEFTEDVELKFLVDGWSPNWGATGFPYGFGTNGGANIPVAAGSYTVVFNDIDGYYHFYSK